MSSVNKFPPHLAYNKLSITPVDEAKPKKSFGATLKRICSAVVDVFTCRRACCSTLKKNHVSIVREFNKQKLLAFPKVKDLGKVQPTKPLEPKFNDETLDGMREFAQQMMGLTIDCIHEKYIKDPVKRFNDSFAPTLPAFLKKLAKQAVSIGAQQAKPIFDIIRQYQVDKEATDQLAKILDWLLLNTKPENEKKIDEFKEKLKEKIKDFTPENAIIDNAQQQNFCSDKLIEWLFNSDHKESPFDLFKNEIHHPSDELITQILQASLLILIEDKIDDYTNKANRILQNNLPTIIQNTLKENAEIITDLLSTRTAELMQKLGDKQFTVLFDKIVEVAGKHVSYITDSHEAAEKAAQDHKELEKYAREIVARNPKNAKEVEVNKRCERYLEGLKNKGGVEAIQQDVLFKTFLALSGHELPCTGSGVTDNIAKLMLETLLPSILKDGKVINGLENLLSQIKLPKEFKSLLGEAEEIAEMIISPEQFKELKELGKSAYEFKDLALESCAEIIKMGLNEAVEYTVKQISKPEELNLMLTKSALPTAKETMIKFFADDLIQANLKKIAPLFQELTSKINDREPYARKERELLRKLFEMVKREAPQYNFKKEDEEDFFRIATPRITEIVELLNKVRSEDPQKSDIKATIAIIKEYYKDSSNSKDNNPHFADFIDMSLRTGEFGSLLPRLFNLNITRSIMSKMITKSVQSFRMQYRPGLNLAIAAARDKYGNEKAIEKLVTFLPALESVKFEIANIKSKIAELQNTIDNNKDPSKEKELSAELIKLNDNLTVKKEIKKKVLSEAENHEKELLQAKKDLPNQIGEITNLGYDILMFKTRKKVPFIGGFLIKKIFGTSAEKLKRLALALFNKLFGYQAFNEQLLNKIFLTSLTGLNMTTTALQGTKPLLQKTSQKELSNIRVPLNVQSMEAKPYTIDVPKPTEKAPLWKRIINFITAKFKELFKCLSQKRMSLSSRQINLMESLRVQDKPAAEQELNVDVPAADKKKEAHHKPDEDMSTQNKARRQNVFKENKELNAPLKKVGEFVSDFMKALGQEIYDEKILPKIDLIKKETANLPEQVKQILDWTNKILAPVANTIVEQIGKKGYKKQLDDASKGFFSILFEDLRDEKGSVKEQSLDKMEAFLKIINTKLGDDDFKKYMVPFKAWVSQGNVKKEALKSLAEIIAEQEPEIANFEFDEGLMRKFYIAAVQWLVNSKIESHVGGIQSFLNDKLGLLIKKHMDNNFALLSEKLFNRVAGLINNISDEDYKKIFFDGSADDVNNQLQNLIKAEKIIEKKGLNDDQKPAAIAKELVSKDKDGNPVYVLHPLARALLCPPEHIKTQEDIQIYKSSQEKLAFELIVKEMLKLTLPKVQKNEEGQVEYIDALQELWESIIIEPEVTQAINEFRQFIKSLLPAKFADKFDVIEGKIKKLTEKFILSSLEQQMTKALAEQLRESFKLFSDANLRKEFLGNNFSMAHSQFVKAFATKIISKNEPEELFKTLIEAEENPDKKTEKLNILNQNIWKLCSEKFKLSWEDLKISPEIFKQDYLPEILRGLTNQNLDKIILSDAFLKENSKNIADLIKTPTNNIALERILTHLLSLLVQSNKKFAVWEKASKNPRLQTAFNIHAKPLILAIVKELSEKENAIRRQTDNPNFKLDEKAIHTELVHYFNNENDNNTKYVDIILNVIKMSKLGGKKIDNFFVKQLTKTKVVREGFTGVLVPAMHPIRASLRGVIDIAADGMRAKYLDGKYIKTLINTKTLKSLKNEERSLLDKIKTEENAKKDLRLDDPRIQKRLEKLDNLDKELKKVQRQITAAEEEIKESQSEDRKNAINDKFKTGLKLTTNMLYDSLAFLTKPNAVFKPEDLFKASETFHEKFFNNEDLNTALLVNLMQKALELVKKKNVV